MQPDFRVLVKCPVFGIWSLFGALLWCSLATLKRDLRKCRPITWVTEITQNHHVSIREHLSFKPFQCLIPLRSLSSHRPLISWLNYKWYKCTKRQVWILVKAPTQGINLIWELTLKYALWRWWSYLKWTWKGSRGFRRNQGGSVWSKFGIENA